MQVVIRMMDMVFGQPGCIIGSFRIVLAKPAAIEPVFVFPAGLTSPVEYRTCRFPVFHQSRLLKDPPSFLAENDPFTVVRKTSFQVPDSSNRSFLNHETVFNVKSRFFQVFVMQGIAVKPGKKISVSVFLQYAVTFLCHCKKIKGFISRNRLLLLFCKMILITDTIRRISQD